MISHASCDITSGGTVIPKVPIAPRSERFSSQIKIRSSEAKHDIGPSNLDTPPRTPTAMSAAARQLLEEISGIHTSLSACSSLAPGPEINALLTRLVDLCIQPYSSAFVNDFFSFAGVSPLCESLRGLCATAEGELERYWTERILVAHKQSSGAFTVPSASNWAILPIHGRCTPCKPC
jgi:nicotianamine synthase